MRKSYNFTYKNWTLYLQSKSYLNKYYLLCQISLTFLFLAYMPFMYVCKQLHETNNAVFGATCLEMSLTSFQRQAVIFDNKQHSYAFMIDGKGRTIFHSSLSKAFSLNVDQEFIPIEFFERDKVQVVESMKRYVWLVVFLHQFKDIKNKRLIYLKFLYAGEKRGKPSRTPPTRLPKKKRLYYRR